VTGALLDPLDTSSIVRALEVAAALEPGSAAVEAAAPYSLEREMGRVAKVLAEAIRQRGDAVAAG
jgi:hypothetical protein